MHTYPFAPGNPELLSNPVRDRASKATTRKSPDQTDILPAPA